MKNEKIVLPRGTVLKLVNLPSGIHRDVIKQAFANYPADIAHVEVTPENSAFIRLRGENDGKLVCILFLDTYLNTSELISVSMILGAGQANRQEN